MSLGAPLVDQRLHRAAAWAPLALNAGGFAYLLFVAFAPPFGDSTTPTTVQAELALWGAILVLAYLVTFLEFRHTVLTPSPYGTALRRVPGNRLAVVSAIMLAVAFILIELLVLFPIHPPQCDGHTACYVPNTLPFTFGLLTPLQLFTLDSAIILFGIVLLAFAIWKHGVGHIRPDKAEPVMVTSRGG
ncbi:MAG: hypothetical protein L3K14_08615 [Thermoplasmata archaeon]|nr:hypothetical protein [Thermoplasmata archaeon]